MINAKVGPYEILEEIGAGGMGTVYRGRETLTGQIVAIKSLRPEFVASDPTMLERFAREGEALRRLNHPNIVKMLAALEQDQQHYLVMEYVGGGSLHDLLRTHPRLPIPRVLTLAIELADALTRAHYLKIIHRDLKPANVLLAEDGTSRLTDFGTAHFETEEGVTETGATVGTLHYLSPEALNGEVVDTRADIWALGVMLYEMLAGRRPFGGGTLSGIINAILREPTPDLETLRSDAPLALVDLIYRMLEKDPHARLQSVRLVGAELEAIIHGLTPGAFSTDRSLLEQHRLGRLGRFETPTPASPVARHNLPAQVTPFVGRQRELDELTRLLDDPQIRLITILAPGGMGKTRLALEVARQRLEQFPQGTFFVSLASLHSAELIVPKIAEVVGFQFCTCQEPKTELLDYFREKSLLLVLDNFEHVGAGVEIAGEILSAAPGIKIIATSREKLNLEGETVFTLSGMEWPDETLAKEILEYSAVKLFIHHARRAYPGFQLGKLDFSYMAHLCQAVQGMPLGLVLAAAWVEVLPLQEIVAEIRQSLDFLETDRRDVPERHHSLRAVFDYSWNSLNQEEQSLFARLSIFRGGFTRQAAQVVTGASLRNLMALANKSLLWRKPDTGRYELHELLRQYAEQRLSSTVEFEPIRQAHCDYYAGFMAQREAELKGARQIPALNEIEADFANIRAMWEYALQRKNYGAVHKALGSLYHFCDMRSRFLEGTDLFRRAAASFASDAGAEAERVRGRLLSRGARLSLLGYLSEQEVLEPWIESSLAIAQSYGDSSELAFCSSLKATYLFLLADYNDLARRLWEESLKLYQAAGDKFYIADVLIWLGLYHADQHQLEAALHYAKQALTLQQEIGNKNGYAWTLYTLGCTNFFLAEGRVEAERYLQEALVLMREKGDLKGITSVQAMLAWLAFCEGDFKRAKLLNEDSLQKNIAADNTYIKAYRLILASLLASILDEDYQRGQQLAEEARPLAIGELANKQLPLDLCRAVAAYGLGNDKAAYCAYQEALKLECEWVVWRIPTLCLSPLILSRIAKKERAVELLALIHHHPAVPEGWRKNWPLLSRLRLQLGEELSPEAYKAAWERGQCLELEAAMRELRAS